MGYASSSGRAVTNASDPRAFGVCDRCGMWWNFHRLKSQFDWRGAALQNLFLLVCPQCYDTPQPQLRAIVVPADPTPIIQARVQDFALASEDNRSLSAPTVTDPITGIPILNVNIRVTQDDRRRSTQPVGPSRLNSEAPGLLQNAVMPLQGTVHYGVQLSLISVTANGTTFITVTCSAPHGLVTDGQVSIEGLTNGNGGGRSDHVNGFFSVIVTSATAFQYQSNVAIPAGSLLGPEANIITCKVGLPRGYTQIPQSGI